MTRRERLQRIFRGDSPDRSAVRLWGASPQQELLHPAYESVHRLAVELTDIVAHESSPFNLHWGAAHDEICEACEQPTGQDEWVDVVTAVRTPAGPLRGVFRKSTLGKPGYQAEYLLKEPADIEKLLSVPYQAPPFSDRRFRETETLVGDRGITVFGLDHAMYGLQRLIGSENFAIWSVECRDVLLDAVEVLSRRIREEALRALDAGVRGVFGWVGPELCIPPLMSPADFDDFVMPFDKPLVDLLHEHGVRVWVHCHGKMGPVLERFVEMGVDVLNPVEPPPMGDVTLAEAFDRVGDRMGLEGNIETHDLLTADEEKMRALVREAVETGAGKRFILCPTSGYMEVPDPDDRLIRNLTIYITEGVGVTETGD